MPKSSQRVLGTDRELRAAVAHGDRTEYRIRGTAGLQLRVTATVTKSWAFAYKSPATGKWAKVALGQYPGLGLADAKDRAADVASAVRKGSDPIHDQRRAALAESFKELAARYMREHVTRNARNGVRSRSSDENQRLLNFDILPTLGQIRAELVTRHQIMHVVDAIADRGALVIADRALGLIRAVYSWACGNGRLDRNPTLGLVKRNAGKARTRVLTFDEIRIFWNWADANNGMSAVIHDAMRLQLLTGVRIGEVLEMPRAELDLDRATWTIAAVRTKANRPHELPLSPLAVSIFRRAIARADADAHCRAERYRTALEVTPWVFPSQRTVFALQRRTKPHTRPRRTTGAFDPYAATRALGRCREAFKAAGIAEPFSTHDLRRTLATQLGNMGVADEIIERILNHAPRSVAGKHYNHARYFDQMRAALEAWGERLGEIVSAKNPTEAVATGRRNERCALAASAN